MPAPCPDCADGLQIVKVHTPRCYTPRGSNCPCPEREEDCATCGGDGFAEDTES